MDEIKQRATSRTKRSDLLMRADEAYLRLLAAAGSGLRDARKRRRISQSRLGALAGLSKSAVSRVERAQATSVPFRDLVRLAAALDLDVRFATGRDPLIDTSDAGHLAIQELLLRLGRRHGFELRVELPAGHGDPRRSIDVCLVDRRARRVLIHEAWNTFGDLGGAARSFDRKLEAAEELAAGMGLPGATVHGVWVVRATRANRTLVARYPEFFAARFPGSSHAWARVLMTGGDPPLLPGFVWTDVGTTRLFAHRTRPEVGVGANGNGGRRRPLHPATRRALESPD